MAWGMKQSNLLTSACLQDSLGDRKYLCMGILKWLLEEVSDELLPQAALKRLNLHQEFRNSFACSSAECSNLQAVLAGVNCCRRSVPQLLYGLLPSRSSKSFLTFCNYQPAMHT